MPFFSIIIPTYNRASVLAKMLKHLKDQTFKDFEVIIVEDVNNNENSYRSILDNSSIVYEYIEQKRNVSAKRNIGASKAKGKYYIFLDDDDRVTNNWLSNFAAVLVKDNIDIAFCAVEAEQENKKKKIIFPEKAYQDERDWGVFLAGAFAVKREIFNKINGYDEMLRYGENTELGIRLKSVIKSRSFINNINLLYASSSGGGSKNVQNTFIANNHILAKHKEWFIKNPMLHFNYLSVLGVVSYKLMKPKLAKKYLHEALTIQYSNPKAWSRYIISLFPFVAKKVWQNR